MTLTGRFDWLPDDQLHVVETLAYVDQLIARAGDLHFAHLEAGAFEVHDVVDGATTSVTVKAVRPVPPALSRIVSDVLNQLRAAVEHVLLVEVRRAEGRALTPLEERGLEMPTARTVTDFIDWPRGHRGRKTLACLRPGAVLGRRIESLMPFHRRDPVSHPLHELAAYTNAAKHRAPAVAATRIAQVNADYGDPRLTPATLEVRPMRIGDVLASAATGAVVPLSIWPSVCLQHPESGVWKVLMKELGSLEEWVRIAAVPVLITGATTVPAIPSRIDTSVPISDLRASMGSAPAGTAFELDSRRIQAQGARMSLQEAVALSTNAGDFETVASWTASLDDDAVLFWTESLMETRLDADRQDRWAAEVEREVSAFVIERDLPASE